MVGMARRKTKCGLKQKWAEQQVGLQSLCSKLLSSPARARGLCTSERHCCSSCACSYQAKSHQEDAELSLRDPEDCIWPPSLRSSTPDFHPPPGLLHTPISLPRIHTYVSCMIVTLLHLSSSINCSSPVQSCRSTYQRESLPK